MHGKVQVGKEEVVMWKMRVCLFRGGRSLKLVRGERERSLLCDEMIRLEGRTAPLGCAVFFHVFYEGPEKSIGGGNDTYVARPFTESRGLGLGVAGGMGVGGRRDDPDSTDWEEGRASIRIET